MKLSPIPAVETGERRDVAEWVATHPDQAIPTRVKLRIWNRCQGRCALTGRKLGVGEPHDFDHIVPLAVGGRHVESNLQIVSREAHRAKTRLDVAIKAKVDRMKAKHLGLYAKSRRPIPQRKDPWGKERRGFEKSRNTSRNSPEGRAK